MRHQVLGKKLGRDIHARRALLRNLSSSLIHSGSIVTTEAKAKFVRRFVEKLIRNSQEKSLARKREIASVLEQKSFLRLIEEIGPGFADRQGGYTRIIRLNPRRGDSAPMAKIELLEWAKSKVSAPKKDTAKINEKATK